MSKIEQPADTHRNILDTFNEAASAYQDKFMDLDLYHDTFDLFCRSVGRPGARILEIGCGPGNATRYLLSKRPDFQLEGIDIAPNMIRLAGLNNPSARFRVMDCREISGLEGGYDGILGGFCLPYLSKEECEKLMRDCAALLTPGGVLYLSTMEGDYEKSGYETSSDGKHRMYIRYHEENYLREYLQAAGFHQIDCVRKDYPKGDGTFSVDLIFVASNN